MILSDKGRIQIEGNTAEVMADLTVIMFTAANVIAKQIGISTKQVEEQIQTAMAIMRLTDAGMSYEEAKDIVIGAQQGDYVGI